MGKQLGSHWKDFRKICYLIIFRKSLENIKFSYNLIGTEVLYKTYEHL